MNDHQNRSTHLKDDDDNDIGLTEAFDLIDDEEDYDLQPRHARQRYADDFDESDRDFETSDTFNDADETDNRQAVHSNMHRSRRVRRILIIVIIVLIVLLVLGGFLVWALFRTSQEEVSEQVQLEEETSAVVDEEATDDASATTVKNTTVPQLVPLLGLTVDEAVVQLEHGAQVSSTQEVNEEDNPIKSESRVVLTDEPSDTRSGAPTVFLGVDEEGLIIQAGYSVATASLGYGSLSFADAVVNETIIENTLLEAGIGVNNEAVSLPEDKAEYSTYADDGTTLTREYCSFSGEVDIDGVMHEWSAVLSYDYSIANATNNLSDTIRTIYIYISA